MARVHLLFSALCALPLCCGSEGISWDVHGVVHSVPATTRKYLGRRSVRVNATSARIVELSGSLEWICAQGESGMPPEITGAIVTIPSTSVLNLPCDDALSYLAFRGAGARAVLAGAATRYPGGDYYLHNGIFTARRAPMPWLDVNDDALRDVVAAVRDGHAVLLEPSASNPWRKLFRSWCWVVIFRVTVPVCALATTYLAVKTLRARGFGELLPVLVLVVEALSMLSIALASSIFGLYWSGDVAGRWVTELHISMYIGGGFFTSVLMSMHLASLRKHLQNTIEEGAGRSPEASPTHAAHIAALFAATSGVEATILLLFINKRISYEMMFFLAEVYSISQMFVAGYFIRGARLGYAFHRRRIRVHLRRSRDSWTAADASTWTAAEIHVHTMTACLALSAVCMLFQSTGMFLAPFYLLEGPTKFTICCALTTGGRVGTALAQVRALKPPPSLVRFDTSVGESTREPLAESGMTRGHGLTPREATRSSNSSMASTPRTLCDLSSTMSTGDDSEYSVEAKVELTDRNLEAHNKRLNPDRIISDPTPKNTPLPITRFRIDTGPITSGARILLTAPATATVRELKHLAELRVRKNRDATWHPTLRLVELCVQGGYSLDDSEVATKAISSDEVLTAIWQEVCVDPCVPHQAGGFTQLSSEPGGFSG